MPENRQPRLKFPRSMRLQKRREFTYLKDKGQRLAQGCLILNWLRNESLNAPRLGVVTSGKIGSAVVRSRARRLLREAFRKRQHELGFPVDIVLVARHSIGGKTAAEVERDFARAIERAGIRRTEQ